MRFFSFHFIHSFLNIYTGYSHFFSGSRVLAKIGASKQWLMPAAHGEENAQQSGMNVILLSKILAVCG